MKNCLILGSGRSGTSMMGGILHQAGYFLGDDLYPGRDSNPKGFFENAEINGINEKILEEYDSFQGKLKRRFLGRSTIYAPGTGQHWLMSLEKEVDIVCENAKLLKRIENAVQKQPFGYKDPRFSYTLPVWKKYLPEDTKFIVMFRAPDVTANSIVKECTTVKYLNSLKMDYTIAMESWVSVYKHVFKHYEMDKGNFIFLHYDQIYHGDGLEQLERFLDTSFDHSFVEKSLKRSQNHHHVSPEAQDVYRQLCQLAGYRDE